jgi:phage replication O-like protein O
MARPQLEDGYTAIANEILEHLYKRHLSPNQWQVTLCVIRKTYGYHKKVDYIANCQIVVEVGLCKSVVSRALKGLIAMNIITRNGRHIGLQKDWEQWKELAELLPKVSSIANENNEEKLANQQPKLAISSTELAELLPKVSSPRVTQNNKLYKRNYTKETVSKISFDEFLTNCQKRYPELDVADEWRRCELWWSEGKKPMKKPMSALNNWLVIAQKKKQQEASNGQDRQNTQRKRSYELIPRTSYTHPDDA